MATQPRTREAVLGNLALEAWRRGKVERAEGDLVDARRWFERAHRLAPHDPVIAMSLASLLVASADPYARTLFSGIAAKHDT